MIQQEQKGEPRPPRLRLNAVLMPVEVSKIGSTMTQLMYLSIGCYYTCIIGDMAFSLVYTIDKCN